MTLSRLKSSERARVYLCDCKSACVRLHAQGCTRASLRVSHNDNVICYGAGELLNPELSLTMTSSVTLKQYAC